MSSSLVDAVLLIGGVAVVLLVSTVLWSGVRRAFSHLQAGWSKRESDARSLASTRDPTAVSRWTQQTVYESPLWARRGAAPHGAAVAAPVLVPHVEVLPAAPLPEANAGPAPPRRNPFLPRSGSPLAPRGEPNDPIAALRPPQAPPLPPSPVVPPALPEPRPPIPGAARIAARPPAPAVAALARWKGAQAPSEPETDPSVAAAASLPSALPTITPREVQLGPLIGRGAFGAVYVGRWRGTRVAIKTLDVNNGSVTPLDTAASQELLQEAALHATLRHPNIVMVMGITLPQAATPGRWGAAAARLAPTEAVTAVTAPSSSPLLQCPAIVTEYCSGGSLWAQLHAGPSGAGEGIPRAFPLGRLPTSLAYRLAADAARGLAYLHGHSPALLHRDLKSPNILVDLAPSATASPAAATAPSSDTSMHADSLDAPSTRRSGVSLHGQGVRLLLGDFGLARVKARSSATATSHAGTSGQAATMTAGLGTLQWMAPEVLAGDKYAEPADIYSLGVVIWELFAKPRVPWDGMAPGAVVLAVSRGDRLPLPPGCPIEATDLIYACTALDPRARPTAATVLERLEALTDAR